MKIKRDYLKKAALVLLVIWCMGAFIWLHSETQELEPRITSHGELMLRESTRVLIVDGQPLARVKIKLLQEEEGYSLDVKANADTVAAIDGVLIFDNEKLLRRVRLIEENSGVHLIGEISDSSINIIISKGSYVHKFFLPLDLCPSLEGVIGRFFYVPCKKLEKQINIPLLGVVREKVEPINVIRKRGLYVLKRDVGGFKSVLLVRRAGEVIAEGVLLNSKKIWLVEEGEEEILQGIPLEKLLEGENEGLMRVLERMKKLWKGEGFLLNSIN